MLHEEHSLRANVGKQCRRTVRWGGRPWWCALELARQAVDHRARWAELTSEAGLWIQI